MSNITGMKIIARIYKNGECVTCIEVDSKAEAERLVPMKAKYVGIEPPYEVKYFKGILGGTEVPID